ncbi:MAG: hypothetical protein PHW82_16970, partial [Bacteroidales bacterium]|nr:hypothetical protein [Bacteroidales bacterium]
LDSQAEEVYQVIQAQLSLMQKAIDENPQLITYVQFREDQEPKLRHVMWCFEEIRNIFRAGRFRDLQDGLLVCSNVMSQVVDGIDAFQSLGTDHKNQLGICRQTYEEFVGSLRRMCYSL